MSKKSDRSRSYKAGSHTLNAGLTVAGLGAAARKTGTELQRTGNKVLSDITVNPRGTSAFGAGASPESAKAARRATKAIKVGSALRRGSKYLPYAGGALAVGGGAVMANEYMKDRKASVVAKKEWSDDHYAARKKAQGILSGASGTAGIAGLGALMVSRGKSPTAQKAAKLVVPLTTTSAGVGGLSSLNFASVSRQEAARAAAEKSRAKAQAAKIRQLDRKVKSISKNLVATPNTKPVMRKPAPVAGRTLTEKNKVVHQRKVLQQVAKASPEHKRLRRLDRYERGLAVGGAATLAGSAGLGAAKNSPKIRAAAEVMRTPRMDGRTTMRDKIGLASDRARYTKPNTYSDGSPRVKRVGTPKASAVRRAITGARNKPLAVAGAGAAMLAGAGGVRRYKNNGGKSYRPLPREQA